MGMAKRQDLKALRRMISEAHQILQTSPELPQGRTARALELLGDSVVLADYLLTIEPAAVLGKMGGKATARKGPEYFRKIAAMRKTKAGGRPRENI
jgi:hypothetical protein